MSDCKLSQILPRYEGSCSDQINHKVLGICNHKHGYYVNANISHEIKDWQVIITNWNQKPAHNTRKPQKQTKAHATKCGKLQCNVVKL